MSFKNITGAVVLGLGSCLLTSQTQAIALTDVSFQNNLGGATNPTAASQGVKRSKKSVINGLGGLFAGDEWSVLDRLNRRSKTFNGVNFTLAADSHQRAGDWSLNWDSPVLTPDMDFVLVLKGGRQWAAYLFEAGSINSDSGSIAGLFDMPLLNKHGKKARLRHAKIFGRIADASNTDPNDSWNPTNPVDAANPTDPTNPTDPLNPTDPTNPTDPLNPTDPANATDPANPTDPVYPVDPEYPQDPINPTDPSDPTDPVDADGNPAPIPLPGSLSLVLLGVTLCGRLLRRRRAL